VDGIFVLGSTGEVALLDDASRDLAVHTVVSTVAGQVPVLVGVIDTGTDRVVAHARRAEAAGADAVVATAPFYVRTHRSETVQHFAAIAAGSGLPVVAYDIPSATAVRLDVDTLLELVERRLVIAIKDSSGDLAATRQLVEQTRNTPVRVLTGSELLADTALAFGADGLVPGLGNVDPDGYVALNRAIRTGDLEAAAEQQRRLATLFDIINIADQTRIGFTAAALGAFKAGARLRGWIDDDRCWPPLGALTDPERHAIAERLKFAGLLA
jgi:4-hydroxy-tetrahydrodipicolinate synthase